MRTVKSLFGFLALVICVLAFTLIIEKPLPEVMLLITGASAALAALALVVVLKALK